MPVAVKQRYCQTCGEYRRAERQVANDLVHGILTVFTVGLWFPVWFIAAFFAMMNPYRCTFCGGVVHAGSRPPRESGEFASDASSDNQGVLNVLLILLAMAVLTVVVLNI